MSGVPVRRCVLFIVLAGLVAAGDIASKSIVFTDLGFPGGVPVAHAAGAHKIFAYPPLRHGESVPFVDGWFTIRFLTSVNRGALWGVGQGLTLLFAGLSVVALIGIPVWLFMLKGARSLWLTVALAFIFGGAIGNLFDRLGWNGTVDGEGAPLRAVRDFILCTFGKYHWPVFNLADVFLVTGAIMLVLQSLFARDLSPAASTNDPSDTERSA